MKRAGNKFNARRAYRCLACGAAQPGKSAACIYCHEKRVHSFDSRAEARRYDALRLKQNARLISDLRVHPRYELFVKGDLIGRYVADFSYLTPGEGVVIEDVKGARATDTALSRWKRKHLEAQAGIPVTVVRM